MIARRAAGRATSGTRRSLAVAALAVALTACATTYDESEAPTTLAATTTTLPSGTPAELLQQLLAHAARLGTLIDEHDSESAPVLQELESTWKVVRPEVEQAKPQLLADMDANVARARTAVERNRPADADKAYRNLVTLVTSFDS